MEKHVLKRFSSLQNEVENLKLQSMITKLGRENSRLKKMGDAHGIAKMYKDMAELNSKLLTENQKLHRKLSKEKENFTIFEV